MHTLYAAAMTTISAFTYQWLTESPDYWQAADISFGAAMCAVTILMNRRSWK